MSICQEVSLWGGREFDRYQLRPGRIVYYRPGLGGGRGGRVRRTGAVDGQKIRRFNRAFEIMLFQSEVKRAETKDGKAFFYRLGFLTLTVPAFPDYSDKAADKCFRLFLKELSRRNFRYIWRKERQENGRLHLHLILEKFIHYQQVNAWWWSTLRQVYEDSYRKYILKHKKPPPAAEIRAIRNLRKCRAYAAKYLSKSGAPVPGNVFGFSRDLSRVKWPELSGLDAVFAVDEFLEEKNVPAKYFDRFTLFIIGTQFWPDFMRKELEDFRQRVKKVSFSAEIAQKKTEEKQLRFGLTRFGLPYF